MANYRNCQPRSSPLLHGHAHIPLPHRRHRAGRRYVTLSPTKNIRPFQLLCSAPGIPKPSNLNPKPLSNLNPKPLLQDPAYPTRSSASAPLAVVALDRSSAAMVWPPSISRINRQMRYTATHPPSTPLFTPPSTPLFTPLSSRMPSSSSAAPGLIITNHHVAYDAVRQVIASLR